MTDSVNCSAFAESMRREILAMERSGSSIAPSPKNKFASVGESPPRPGLAHQGCDINHSKFNVEVRLKKFVLRVADLELPGQELPRFWKNLHQADGVLGRNGVRLKRGFLANKAGGKHGIEIILGGLAPQSTFIGHRIKRLPCGDRHVSDLA